MDPLSAGASILTVLDASGKALKVLRSVRKAPEEVLQLIEEVTCITAVLEDVKSATYDNQSTRGLDLLLEKANAKLLELNKLIYYELTKAKENVEVERLSWVKYRRRAESLRDQLRSLRHDITALLSATTYSRSAQVRLQVDQLVLASTQQAADQQFTSSALARYEAHVEALFQRIEESHETQERLIGLLGNFRQIASATRDGVPGQRSPDLLRQNDLSLLGHDLPSLSAQSRPLEQIHVKARRSITRDCVRPCRCACHKKKRIASPMVARKLLGAATISYTGINVLRKACNISTCRATTVPTVQINYSFPAWLASTMICMWMSSAPLSGPEVLLKTKRTIKTNAFYHVGAGDLEALRYLYIIGQASVHDVHPLDGGSALTEAAKYGEYEIIQFLLESGADPSHEDFNSISFRDYVLEEIFRAGRSSSRGTSFASVIDVDDVIDDQEYTPLHRIVLGLSNRDATEELQEYPELLNAIDAKGRTALWWSADLGKLELSKTLLGHGADINMADAEGCTALHMAASFGNSSLIEFLLDSGAEITETKNGVTPLHLASEYNSCSEAVHLMLSHGAPPNAREVNGISPLHCSAQFNAYECAEILLQHGADKNDSDAMGWETWRTAVYDRSAQVLRNLIIHGCHLAGLSKRAETILHHVALYGDEEIVTVLEEVQFGDVDTDAVDILGNTAEDYLAYRFYVEPPILPPCSNELYKRIKRLMDKVRITNARVDRIAESTSQSNNGELDFDIEDSSRRRGRSSYGEFESDDDWDAGMRMPGRYE